MRHWIFPIIILDKLHMCIMGYSAIWEEVIQVTGMSLGYKEVQSIGAFINSSY